MNPSGGNRMKKMLIAAVWIFAAAGTVTTFGNTEVQALTNIDTSVEVQPGMRIAVVSKSKKGQFWSMLRQGMEAGVAAVNEAYQLKKGDKITMTFEGPDSELKVEDQINTIDAVLSENPDALCLSAIDMDSCQAQLEMAREIGIPVVIFDSNVVDVELVTAFRATDNLELGKQAGEALAAAMEESGEVLVFSAQEKTESIQNRIAGLTSVFEACPDIILDEVFYEDQVENMSEAMTQALADYPEVKGVICTNADTADIYLALAEELREGICFVGVDATTKQQDAVKNGKENSILSQDPCLLGYETILSAVYAAMLEEYPDLVIEKEILLPPQKIDANNIYNPQYSNYLYTE